MITSYIDMNRKAGFKELRAELAACREACQNEEDVSGKVYLIARMARDLSEKEWGEFCKTHSMGDWLALRLPAELVDNPDCGRDLRDWLVNSPWILSKAAFRTRLDSELLRVARGGGPLCLLLAAVAREKSEPLDGAELLRLERILRDTLDGQLEVCDSLCLMDGHSFGVILPGLGQLKSRRFAERAQALFLERAKTVLPDGEQNAACAVGLVNIVPGEYATPASLLGRVRKALDYALEDSKGHIYQESPTGEASGATLVHSNEKHFLFFGGTPK